MKRIRVILPVFLLFAITPCFAHHLAVVANKDNHVADMAPSQLARIYRLESRKWQDGRDIVLVLHRDSPGEVATLAHLTHMSAEEIKAFITTHKDSVTLADSDGDVLRIVESMPGAIGFVDVRSINDQIRVVKIGGKLPMEDGYLSH